MANPIGVFASKDFAKETSGLALRGNSIDVSILLKLSTYFGLGAAYRNQSHNVDNALIQQMYTSTFSGVSLNTKTGKWLSSGFYGGLYFNAPVKTRSNLAMDFSLMMGLPKFQCPSITVSGTQYEVTSSLVQYSDKTNAFAFCGRVGLNYRYKILGLNLGVSYFRAKPEFSNVLVVSPNGSSGYINFKQTISTLNVEAGISLLLFR